MGYAEVELTDARGATSRVTFDSHGYRDLVSYRKRRLGRAEQRRWAATAAAAAREIVLRGGRRQLLNSRSSVKLLMYASTLAPTNN